MKKSTVTLHLERETKGAIRYQEPSLEEGDPHYLIGTLYLRKRFLQKEHGGTVPLSIKVTIEETTP